MAATLSSCATAPALPDVVPTSEPRAATYEKGRALYERNCAACHGPKGEGHATEEGTALGNQEFLATVSDEFIAQAIRGGRQNTAMRAWAVTRGGPLSSEDVNQIVGFIRRWQTKPSVALAERPRRGDAARGASIYAAECARCHGETGTKGRYVALASPDLLAAASDAYLAAAIERGRPDTPMPTFRGWLTEAQIDDVVALLRSWERPPADISWSAPDASAPSGGF